MIAELIGIPYDLHNKKGVNCWGLVALVYDKMLGKSLISFDVKSYRDIANTFTQAFIDNAHGFKKTDKPNNFDVVTMNKGKLFHCGIYHDGNILHSSLEAKQVVYEKYNNVVRQFEVIEFWQM